MVQKETISLDDSSEEAVAIAIGFFDGVHLGHKALIEEVLKYKEYIPSVLTFTVNMKEDMHKTTELIQSDEERTKRLESLGVRNIMELEFNERLMHTSCQDFLRFLRRLHAKVIVIGSDFTFGEHALGNAEMVKTLERDGIKVIIKDLIVENGSKISSTYIKELIRQGEVQKADQLLGYCFSVVGKADYNRIRYPAGIVHLPDGKYETEVNEKITTSTIFTEDGISYIHLKTDDLSQHHDNIIRISFIKKI